MQLIDQYAKLLEVDHEYIFRTPIPTLKALVAARLSNLQESRLKADKTGDIDIFSREDYYGLQALTMTVNALFGGKTKSVEDKGTKNISGFTQIKR